MATEKSDYPGSAATPVQTIGLADQYRVASGILREHVKRGERLAWAPFRAVSIHAIELYLNVFLQCRGRSNRELRVLHHDLAQRTKLATEAGLKLRKLTADHLGEMTANREFLVMRYDAVGASTVGSQVNRMSATLDEVAAKVTTCLAVEQTTRPAIKDRKPALSASA